jgi:hypothetical protein
MRAVVRIASWPRFVLACSALVLGLSACSKKPAGGSAPAASASTALAVDSAAGMSIEVPAAWTRVDLQKDTVERFIKAHEQSHPAAAHVVKEYAANMLGYNSTGKSVFRGHLWAMDLSAPKYPSTIWVIKTDKPPPRFLEMFEMMKSHLVTAGGTGFEKKVVKLPVGDTHVISYNIPQQLPGGQAPVVKHVEYIVLRPNTAYVIGMVTADPARDGAAMDRAAQSFKIF